SPTLALVRLRVGLSFSAPATAPASVTSRPSRIQVMPSATTTSVWNRPHGSRSRRAGMVVFTSGPKFLLITALSATTPKADIRQPVKLAAKRSVNVSSEAILTPIGTPPNASRSYRYENHNPLRVGLYAERWLCA